MSFLFDKRNKRILRGIWMVVAVLVILSMVLFFAPGIIELGMAIFGR